MLCVIWMAWKFMLSFQKSRPTKNKYMEEERKEGHIRLIEQYSTQACFTSPQGMVIKMVPAELRSTHHLLYLEVETVNGFTYPLLC